MGTNHVVFLERVTELFEKLSISLPQYQQHYETCKRKVFEVMDKSRLAKLMALVYADVINLFGEVYLILARKTRRKFIASVKIPGYNDSCVIIT